MSGHRQPNILLLDRQFLDDIAAGILCPADRLQYPLSRIVILTWGQTTWALCEQVRPQNLCGPLIVSCAFLDHAGVNEGYDPFFGLVVLFAGEFLHHQEEVVKTCM